MFNRQVFYMSLSLLLTFIPVSEVKAQTIRDNTLGNESSVITPINSVEDRIDGGAIRGTNLFHSFQEFNINTGRSVYFSNPTNIQNILTRITGNNPSQIDGTLGVNGNANLFLINPNGIVFGKDASLDINGSFVGSSANSINFADGKQFSAVLPGDEPLLTISTPIGLGLDNPGDITVQGNGHNFVADTFFTPFINNTTKVLEVNPGKTIALIGGNIILDGGSLKTESGKIELGSVSSGIVDFNVTAKNLKFSYDNVETFQDIQISNKAVIDASSLSINTSNSVNNFVDSGFIQLQGRNISLSDRSIVLNNNQSNLPSGSINVNATESLELQNSVLRSQAFLLGEGGDIVVSTNQLLLEGGAGILAFNYGDNSGGNIEIKTSDSVKVIGVLDETLNEIEDSTAIVTNTFSNGDGGNVEISTRKLNIVDSGLISSSTFDGNAGNLIINASESIEVVGIDPNLLQPSVLTSVTLGSGNGGNLILNTKRLTVKDGGRVDASTVASGAAGSITINASETVELSGSDPEVFVPSLITSSAIIEDEVIQQRFGLPSIITGKSGEITINTGQLNITDGALLIVKNDGTGDAGILKVNADAINVSNKSTISASNQSGDGGNIDLQTQNLFLRRNSNISATSPGTGNGGNITINTQTLTALENSDITANSEGSFGGKVQINVKGIFGTEFREFLTPQSDITATSGLGAEFNGVVDINNLAIAPNPGLVELSQSLSDSDQRIAAGCSVGGSNKFAVTGNGGLPQSPNGVLDKDNPYVDLVDLVPHSMSQSLDINSDETQNLQQEIVEAKGWTLNSKGEVVLVAKVVNSQSHHLQSALSPASCKAIEG